MNAAEIHARLGAQGWRQALLYLGVSEKFLVKKNGPCPACGGKDRFSFDNRRGRGDFFCRGCSPGDGFQLLMRIFKWEFAETARRVVEATGIKPSEACPLPAIEPPEPDIARPTGRILRLMREACAIEDCEPVRRYMESRCLWPMPERRILKAHPSVDYWQEGKKIGVFAALIAPVRDLHGELVTVHVTYLDRDGHKITEHESRKLLSGLVGRDGCAVQLGEATDGLGIAEGIETALSAEKLHGLTVWAALNTSLLARFTPPPSVKRLVIYADRDVAGLDAASRLMERLQGKIHLQIKMPQSKDWNDVLRAPL